jgi:hypothetical protein
MTGVATDYHDNNVITISMPKPQNALEKYWLLLF